MTTGHLMYWLGTALIACILFIGLTLILNNIADKIEHATIAGVTVPVVACEEDEVIGWVAVDTLGCVHFEEVR